MSHGPPVRVERVARDHADPVPTHALVQALCGIPGHGIEHEQRPPLPPSLHLGVLHEQLRDAAPACRAVDEQLRDLGSVWLVRRQREDDLHRADQLTVGEGREQEPASLLRVVRYRFEHVAPSRL